MMDQMVLNRQTGIVIYDRLTDNMIYIHSRRALVSKIFTKKESHISYIAKEKN